MGDVTVWYCPVGESPIEEASPPARAIRFFGGSVEVTSATERAVIGFRDNWGDERFPWKVRMTFAVGTLGAVDMHTEVLDEFATLRGAIRDAKRRVREHDHKEAR